MTKLLYFDSLNAHMKKYMDDVKLSDINDSLQAQKIKLLRQVELSNISQAEAAIKLEELKKVAMALNSNEVIPYDKTASPELVIQNKPEEYSPLTATRYEKAIQNKMTLTKKNGVYKNQSLIDELKEKLQKRNQSQLNNEIFKEGNVREVKKTIDGLITGMIERGKELKSIKPVANTLVENLISNVDKQQRNEKQEMLNKLLNAKKVEIERRKAVKNTMDNMLDQIEIKSVIDSMLDKVEANKEPIDTSKAKKKASKKTIASSKTSTTASTTSSAADMRDIGKQNFNTIKKNLRDLYVKKFDIEKQTANQMINKELSLLSKREKIPYMNLKLSGGGFASRKFRNKRILL